MDIQVIVQSLFYLSYKLKKPIDKLTALKLMFFADRYHLRKYAATITNDTYYALRLGPVPSMTKSILESGFNDGKRETAYCQKFLTKEDGIKSPLYIANKNITENDLDYLSLTEREALDFAVENFGKFSSSKLVDETHKYPEWKRFEKSLTELKSEKINMADFFSNPLDTANDPFSTIDPALLELTKEEYLSRVN